MINLKTIYKSESGYASFVIALITMIVVSLIVVAFASDSRLEQKNSLANVLATQAYYAAESGINDALAVMTSTIDSGGTPQQTTGCNSAPYNNNSNIDTTHNITYSCVSVNPYPSTLYETLSPGEGVTLPLTSKSASDQIDAITVSWEYYQSSINGHSLTYGGCPNQQSPSTALNLPPNSAFTPSNCGAGVIQIDLVSGTVLSNNPTNQQTLYLEPESYGGSPAVDGNDTPPPPVANAYPLTTEDSVYYAECNETNPASGIYACTATIQLTPDQAYYLHLTGFYQQQVATVTALDSSNNPVDFTGSQVDIDSTGQANSQIKRLNEVVCYGDFCNSGIPTGAIESTQCINKMFYVWNGGSSSSACP
jgi:hypothetical protein